MPSAATHTEGLVGNSHEFVVTVPFSRQDVYKELISPDAPLGIDMSKVEVTIRKSWNDSKLLEEVRASPSAGRESARMTSPCAQAAALCLTRARRNHRLLPAVQLEVGCIRETKFQGVEGKAVSELIELEPETTIRWHELETTVQHARMVGIGRWRTVVGPGG